MGITRTIPRKTPNGPTLVEEVSASYTLPVPGGVRRLGKRITETLKRAEATEETLAAFLSVFSIFSASVIHRIGSQEFGKDSIHFDEHSFEFLKSQA